MSTASKTVTVYSTLGCGYTDMLKEQLDRDGIEYEEVNLSLHPERWPRGPAPHRRTAHQPGHDRRGRSHHRLQRHRLLRLECFAKSLPTFACFRRIQASHSSESHSRGKTVANTAVIYHPSRVHVLRLRQDGARRGRARPTKRLTSATILSGGPRSRS